jgi:hypothetical protein
MEVKQQAEQASDQAKSKWAQMKADVSAKMDEIKSEIDKRADERDARAAEKAVDRGEEDASDAIDYTVSLSTVRGWPCSTRWMRGLRGRAGRALHSMRSKVRDCADRVDIEDPQPLLDNRQPVHDFRGGVFRICLQEQHDSWLSTDLEDVVGNDPMPHEVPGR